MKKLIFALLFLRVSTAFADDIPTGNELLLNCQAAVRFADTHALLEKDVQGASSCLGVVHGVSDIVEAWDKVTLISIPGGYTTGQGVRVVVKYLQDHPEKLNERDYCLLSERSATRSRTSIRSKNCFALADAGYIAQRGGEFSLRAI